MNLAQTSSQLLSTTRSIFICNVWKQPPPVVGNSSAEPVPLPNHANKFSASQNRKSKHDIHNSTSGLLEFPLLFLTLLLCQLALHTKSPYDKPASQRRARLGSVLSR